MSGPPSESEFVFNIVWTGATFPFLAPLVASQFANTDARFRFVVNGCASGQVELMEAFAARQGEQIVEVFVSSDEMERHGRALDRVLAARDDGEYFAFIDPDIIATGPFVPDFADALTGGCAGVTSGRGIWNDDAVIPEGHPGVAGEFFYDRDGFLFGSPHFAMYRRDAVERTCRRWGIGFGSAGRDIPDAARARLESSGHAYWLFDTGKVVNILLQLDGASLCHFEHPALVHFGGMSHYLSPPDGEGGAEIEDWEPDQSVWEWPDRRLALAKFTAAVLRRLLAGEAAPAVPAGIDPADAELLTRVRQLLLDVVAPYVRDVERDAP